MNPKIRNILIIALIVAVVVTFHIVRRNATMRGIESVVISDNRTLLLTPDEVDSLILAQYPKLLKSDIKDVDCKLIQKTLNSHPYILSSTARMTMGGKLAVKVTQHKPVVRAFYHDKEFYVSRDGTVMPLSATHYCHILVGNGDGKGSLTKIWKLASFLSDNPKYGEVFDQVYVSPKGDLYLVPKLGSLSIEVGDTNQLAGKFENLWAFFDQGVNQVGWDMYKSISLKYRDQVVCTKR